MFASLSWMIPKVSYHAIKPRSFCLLTNCNAASYLMLSDTALDADKLFEHDLGALNMAALNRRVERAGLLSNLGPCCKALCARRDFAIRRQLLKNEKVNDLTILKSSYESHKEMNVKHPPPPFFQGLAKQYPTTPVVDNELLQMSMRLFRRTMAGQATAPEKTDSGPALAAEDAEAGSNKLNTAAQPEVCVS